MTRAVQSLRHLVLALALASLLAGCAEHPLRPIDRQRWAAAWIDSFNSGRWTQMAPLLADCQYRDPYLPAPWSGALLSRYLTGLWQKFPGIELRTVRVGGDSRSVTVEWQAVNSTKQQRPPARGVSILEIDAGRLRGVRSYFDRGRFETALSTG